MSPNSPTRLPPDVGVVIAAGGRGTRIGGEIPKQFRSIAGVPMLLRSIRPFASHPRVVEVIVVLPEPMVETPPEWLAAVVGDRLRLAAGGETRAESVARGVARMQPTATTVLIHDAARPFVAPETVDAVIERAAAGACAVAAVPVTDTVKRADPSGRWVRETIDRGDLWRAQTPQGFPRAALNAAYEKGLHRQGSVTDEAALMEGLGHRVELVADSTTNFKITTAEDFRIAEAMVHR